MNEGTKFKTCKIILIFLLGMMCTGAIGRTIYVDGDTTGANDGSSWENAFNYLQDALADANSAVKPVEIRVAQGTYKPDQGDGIMRGDRTATFQLINGITLKGGFAGFGEPNPDDRDIVACETILNGDLNGDDVEVADPCDLLTEPTRSENSYHIVAASEMDANTILDGFTITGGNANEAWPGQHRWGGGIFNSSGSPMLTKCTLSMNSARAGGGGMYNDSGGNPRLINCTFSGNSGIAIVNYKSYPRLINCTFSGNSGGGMSNDHSILALSNCIFIRNVGYHGGAIENVWSSLTLTNCIFIGNSDLGYGGGGLRDYASSTTITDCIFTGNSASGTYGSGGAIRFDDSSLSITNTTFSGNLAVKFGGGIYCPFPPMPSADLSGSSAGLAAASVMLTLNNCILWENSDSSGEDESAQIDVWMPPVVNYSCIQGWTDTLGGIGNIGDDPLFMAPGYWDANGAWVDGDYHLLVDSPCIDAGDPNYIAEPNETDLDGKSRVIGGRIDMGAYECSSPIPAEVRIVPHTINLASKGKWIAALLWLPEEYNVVDIDPDTVLLEGEFQADSLHLNEEKQFVIASFNYEEVQAGLDIGEVELTISGQLTDGTPFEATDVIRVLNTPGQ